MTATAQSNLTQPLVTLDEFSAKYADQRVELVRGKIVELPMPHSRHGQVCNLASFYLSTFVYGSSLGHVLSNDTLVVTKRDPDTSRGMDACFISFKKVPKGPLPNAVLEVAPDLVIEVRSPTDLWTDLFAKVSEYLAIGVTAVVILDPNTESASVYRNDTRQEIFEANQTLIVPDVLPGFEVLVKKFFE